MQKGYAVIVKKRPVEISPTGLKANALILLVLFLGIIFLQNQGLSYAFQYERSLILNGEYWRIFTGHFTHIGWKHLFLNILTTGLVFALFYRTYSLSRWLIGAVLCILGVSLGLLLFSPDLEWYMGLSGLLYGLLIMGIVGEIRKGIKLYFIGLLAIVCKILVEQYGGQSLVTAEFIQGNVVTDAHLYGAISGGIMVCLFICVKEVLPKGINGSGLARKSAN